MRFIKLELTGAPTVELPLHRQMTVVGADGEAERLRLAEALAGRARDGVVWAFDDEDPSEEQVPIGDFAILGLPPGLRSAMLLRTLDIPAAAAKPLQPEPVQPDPILLEAAAEEAEGQARAELEARRARLAGRPVPVADTATQTAVTRALTELREAEEYAEAAADDARRIRADWEELATALAAPGPSDEALAAVEASRAELAQRRDELAAARLAVGHGPVSPENAAVIGHLHTEVTNAQARVDRPFPGSAARRRLAEAEEAEAKFLEELGFSSYTAYLLDAVVSPADPEPLRRLSSAERAVAEAEVAWQNVAPTVDELYVHESRQRQAAQLQERAAALLGFDPGNALAERLADWPESCVRLTETRVELQRVLHAAGVAPELDPVATAEEWLAARRAEKAEQAALEAELAEIEAELAALQRAAAERAVRVETRQAEAARAALDAEAESLDAYLGARLAVHRHAGPIGSLPLILDEAFADLPPADRRGGLAQLAEMSATVQVIYLTTDPEVLAWAATTASDHVVVQRPAPMVPATPAPTPAPPPPAPAPYVPPAPTPAPPPPAPAPYVPPAPAPAPPPPPPYVPPAPTPAPPPPPAPYVPPVPASAPSESPLPAAPAEAAADAGASGAPTSGPRCMECHHDLAVGDCHQCRASFCGDHLVRMKRSSRPPLCLSCALVAAGARRGRR